MSSWISEFSFEENVDPKDPRTLYVTSVDKRGHSRLIQVRVPPEWEARVHKVIGEFKSAGVGYDTVASFVRDAIIHRTIFWEEEMKQRGRDEFVYMLNELNKIIIAMTNQPSWEERVAGSKARVDEWRKRWEFLYEKRAVEEIQELRREVVQFKQGLFSWDREKADRILEEIDDFLL